MGAWRIDTEHAPTRVRTDRPAAQRGPIDRVGLLAWLPAVVGWLLVVRLEWALLRTDLTFRYVAEHSVVGESWWYRAAALWGGMEGSLLLFATATATVAAVAIAATPSTERRLLIHGTVLAAVVAIGAIALVLAWPFARLDVPAVQGFGLTPILRHWAMVVHPPLLYVGIVCTLPPHLGGRGAHRWLLAAVAALTTAMALGGFWSYVEQDWGGYWGWDPVENTSLAVWLASLVALHGGRGASERAIVLRRLPFVVALAGAAVARSGVTASVHSFAESGEIGAALGAVAAACLAAVAIDSGRRVRGRRRAGAVVSGPAAAGTRLDGWRTTSVLLAGGALAVVVLFTAAPMLAGGGDGARLEGRYFARALGAFAGVVAVALVALLVRDRGRVGRGGWIAHAGMVVLLAGAAGSAFDRAEQRWVPSGETVAIAGVSVTHVGLEVGHGPTPGSTEVVAVLDVAGHPRRPALVSFPERGGALAETALVSRPWRDVQVVLITARDDGRALLEVRTKPLVPLAWLGASMVVVGALVARRDVVRRRRAAARAAAACAAAAR